MSRRVVGVFAFLERGTMTEKTISRVGAANLLGLTVRHIDNLREQGLLSWHYRGLRVCIDLDSVHALAASRRDKRVAA